MQSVLIVDDEPLILDSAKSFLERFGGMEVSTAVSAKEALALLAEKTFDALVIDYSLPEISGTELLKILRAKGDTTPVILFTGVGREHAAIEALNNGADFFLKKGESPSSEYRELVHMINRASERRLVGRSLGTSEKLLEEIVNFFPDAAYAINREAKVIAWNRGMEVISGINALAILGKGDGAYAVPFFGKAHPMLADLVFEKDEVIEKNRYRITGRDDNTICAWTVARGGDGTEKVLWMKAAVLHDAKGAFIGAIGSVRDITDDLGQELLRQAKTATGATVAGAEEPGDGPGQVIGRLMGKARSNHREGLRLYYRESKYEEAIAWFDKAIEIDPSHAAAWHDRGLCLRELGKDAEALRSFSRATDLSPDDEEFLSSYAGMLRRMGVLCGQSAQTEAAVTAFSRIVERNPNNAEAWNSLGICMKELGKEMTAAQYFDRANSIIRQNKAKKNARNFDALV